MGQPLDVKAIPIGHVIGATLLLYGMEEDQMLRMGDSLLDELIDGVKGNRQDGESMTLEDQKLLWASVLRKCLEIMEASK